MFGRGMNDNPMGRLAQKRRPCLAMSHNAILALRAPLQGPAASAGASASQLVRRSTHRYSRPARLRLPPSGALSTSRPACPVSARCGILVTRTPLPVEEVALLRQTSLWSGYGCLRTTSLL
jgi:hypothetical protein